MTDNLIDIDLPLKKGHAVERDKLGRTRFAESVVSTLRRVSPSSGFVVSIEGAWGSGKTSTLAMIEELLAVEAESSEAVVVHFNPWLVGDRDALLRQFLSTLASAVEHVDQADEGRKVAKELNTYSKAFDLVKLIPGAEPWATIVKSVFATAGEVTGAIAEYKTPDIERRKAALEVALQKYTRPIIVFVDDVDRLFPAEVYEMVRIVKAVGDLPNVGYILAWDPAYVTEALKNAGVPQSDAYLDKVVQVRMPLPSLSVSAREALVDEAMKALHPGTLKSHFGNDSERLPLLYFSGLRDILEHPRDVPRVFSTVNAIEPALRGELAFADILGLAALMVKAPAVFELLRKSPRWFVGKLPGDRALIEKDEELLREGAEPRRKAYDACPSPRAARKLVHFLFPLTAKNEESFVLSEPEYVKGHIGNPARLLVALQLSLDAGDVSLVSAGKYLVHSDQRQSVAEGITADNCLEFLEGLGDLTLETDGRGIGDVGELSLAISHLVDTVPFVARVTQRRGLLGIRAEEVAEQAIARIIGVAEPTNGPQIATSIVRRGGLSLAARILVRSYLSTSNQRETLLSCPASEKDGLFARFSENVLQAAKEARIFSAANPSLVLWTLARVAPERCPEVFAAIQIAEPSLDEFARALLNASYDSHKGQAYALPQDTWLVEAYTPLEALRDHGACRLHDQSLGYPERAVWRALVEGSNLYAVDGTAVDR